VNGRVAAVLGQSSVNLSEKRMADPTKLLSELMTTIENLCLENEVTKIMLQEYWPPTEKLSWRATMNQNCAARKDHFYEQIAGKLPVPELVAPAQFYAILAALTQAIQETQEASNLRVEKLKGS
jgi:hypothetical protein